MLRHRRAVAVALGLVGLTALAPAAASAARTSLVGTFQIAPGRYTPAKGKQKARATGSFFRMTYPTATPT